MKHFISVPICSSQAVAFYRQAMKHFISVLILMVLPQICPATESIASPLNLSKTDVINYRSRNMNISGLLRLHRETDAGQPLTEFSGLAWDADEKRLYALSDRGYVIHLEPVFRKGKLHDVLLLQRYNLLDAAKRTLTGQQADSEGLALIHANNGIKGDTELVISFERQPRIVRYRTDGELVKRLPLTPELHDITQYAHANKALEALTDHPTYEFISASERPLKNSAYNLFAHQEDRISQWRLATSDVEYGAMVGMTTMPDGKIIALERIFRNIFSGVTSVIHVVDVRGPDLHQRQILKLHPADNVFNDNFEAISWHQDKHFFMISDDNDSIFQRSILVYFEIIDLDKHQ